MKIAAAWELGTLDAHAQIELVEKGEVSRRELVTSAILRCEDADPLLNALSIRAFDRALSSVERLPDGARFAGIPYLLKDSLDYPGLPSRCGSTATGDALRTHGFAFVDRLDAEGLVAIGKSNMPEFALLPSTEPIATGPTHNPRAPGFSCGGSSGGAATAVAAGLVPVAHGSDGGGSIRIPAACCGLIGYKPGRGYNLRPRPSQTIEDLIVGDALIARSARDTSWAARMLRPADAVMAVGGGGRPLRIGMVAATLQGRAPHADVAAGLDHSARLLEALGHGIEVIGWPAAFDDVIDSFASMWAVLAREISAWVTDPQSPRANELFEPWTIALARSVPAGPAPLESFFRTLATASQAAEQLFARYDILLCPTVATPPPPIGHLAPTRSYEALRTAIYDFVAYTPLQNLVGLPSVSVPTFRGADGLPIGSMLTAARGGDDMLLDLVTSLEEAGAWSTAITRPVASDPAWAALRRETLSARQVPN